MKVSDLLNNEFGDIGKIISQVAPGTTVGDTSFLKAPSMSNALANLEKSFDSTIEEFQKYFSGVYEDTKQQSDIAFQENARRTAEIGQGMSTGQFAISKQSSDVAQQETNEQIAQAVEQQYNESVSQLQTAFGEQLTQLFGKIDDNGRFSALSEYASYADKATNALMLVAARMMKDSLTTDAINLAKQKGYMDNSGNIINATGFLQEQGILEVDVASGGYYLSEVGYNYIDAILNSEFSINSENNVYDRIIDEMINYEYDLDTQDKWSDTKRQEIEQQYSDFLSDYAQEWRYTHIGLWKQTSDGIQIDMFFETSNKEQTQSLDDLKKELGIRTDMQITYGEIKHNYNLDITFNGIAYDVEVTDEKLDAKVADNINKRYLAQTGTELTSYALVVYDNKIYAKLDNDYYRLDADEWNNGRNQEYSDLLKALGIHPTQKNKPGNIHRL